MTKIAPPTAFLAISPVCGGCWLRTSCCVAGTMGPATMRSGFGGIVRRRLRLPAGRLFIQRRALMRSLYLVRFGTLASMSEMGESQDRILGFDRPGDLIGTDAIGDGVYRLDVRTVEDSELCEIPYDEATLGHIATSLSGGKKLHQILMQNAATKMELIHILAEPRAEDRLNIFLAGWSRQLRQKGQSSTEFDLPMKLRDLANHLGITPEALSRAFRALREARIVAFDKPRVHILRPEALAEPVFVDDPVPWAQSRARARQRG